MFGNLSIRSKMVALLAVPVAAATLLAGAWVADGVGGRVRADRDRRLAAAAARAATAVHELQEERAEALAWVAGGDRRDQAALAARRWRADRALDAWRAGLVALGPTGEVAVDRALARAAARLERLAAVRAAADGRRRAPERVGADHDAIVTGLLVATRGLVVRLDAPEPVRMTRLLLALADAKEATGQERTLLAAVPPADRLAAGARTAPGSPPSPAADPRAARAPEPRAALVAPRAVVVPEVAGRLVAAAAVARHELNGVRVAAGGRLDDVDRALATEGVRQAGRLELALLEPAPAAASAGRSRAAGGPSAPGRSRAAEELSAGDLAGWRAGLAARAAGLRRVERELSTDLAAAAASWQRRREARLRGQLALLMMLALAATVAAWLLRRTPGRSAGVEAATGALVVGLARRSRVLVDHQLLLVDELARDEPDPGRRHGWSRLGHLAARLRRNGETLAAMAGSEPATPPGPPVPVADLLRAAIAEVEPRTTGELSPSRRFDLLATDEVAVAGEAADDLVHLVAELLDNAAAFSPPSAGIAVTGAVGGDGYLIEVTDRGLGMTDEDLAWANRRLAGPSEPAAGDRIGLAVVGRLAARHGLGVRLMRSATGGVTAAVRLPAAALTPRTTAPVRRS